VSSNLLVVTDDPCDAVICAHGVCSGETYICLCNDGYRGDQCDVATAYAISVVFIMSYQTYSANGNYYNSQLPIAFSMYVTPVLISSSLSTSSVLSYSSDTCASCIMVQFQYTPPVTSLVSSTSLYTSIQAAIAAHGNSTDTGIDDLLVDNHTPVIVTDIVAHTNVETSVLWTSPYFIIAVVVGSITCIAYIGYRYYRHRRKLKLLADSEWKQTKNVLDRENQSNTVDIEMAVPSPSSPSPLLPNNSDSSNCNNNSPVGTSSNLSSPTFGTAHGLHGRSAPYSTLPANSPQHKKDIITSSSLTTTTTKTMTGVVHGRSASQDSLMTHSDSNEALHETIRAPTNMTPIITDGAMVVSSGQSLSTPPRHGTSPSVTSPTGVVITSKPSPNVRSGSFVNIGSSVLPPPTPTNHTSELASAIAASQVRRSSNRPVHGSGLISSTTPTSSISIAPPPATPVTKTRAASRASATAITGLFLSTDHDQHTAQGSSSSSSSATNGGVTPTNRRQSSLVATRLGSPKISVPLSPKTDRSSHGILQPSTPTSSSVAEIASQAAAIARRSQLAHSDSKTNLMLRPSAAAVTASPVLRPSAAGSRLPSSPLQQPLRRPIITSQSEEDVAAIMAASSGSNGGHGSLGLPAFTLPPNVIPSPTRSTPFDIAAAVQVSATTPTGSNNNGSGLSSSSVAASIMAAGGRVVRPARAASAATGRSPYLTTDDSTSSSTSAVAQHGAGSRAAGSMLPRSSVSSVRLDYDNTPLPSRPHTMSANHESADDNNDNTTHQPNVSSNLNGNAPSS
jgi:hypothetical protein